MYKYTQEQLDSMKKVEATREQRLKTLFGRMTADEKQTVLKENHPTILNRLMKILKLVQTRAAKFYTNLQTFSKANREFSIWIST